MERILFNFSKFAFYHICYTLIVKKKTLIYFEIIAYDLTIKKFIIYSLFFNTNFYLNFRAKYDEFYLGQLFNYLS